MLISEEATTRGLEAHVDDLREALLKKRDHLRQLITLRSWQAADGTFPPDEAAQLSTQWETVETPHDWLTKETSKTFYHQLRLPAEYCGIALLGQRVELLFCALTGATLYANGRRVYSAEYWADTQVIPIELVGSLEDGLALELVLQMKQGDSFGLFLTAGLSIEAIDEWIFKLDTFAEEIGFALFLARNNLDEHWMLAALREALASFDVAALEQDRWTEIDAAMDATRQSLAGFKELAKEYRVTLVGHAHIDMNWLWPSWETLDLIRRDFEAVDRLMEEFPDFCFSHSMAAAYKSIQDEHPELWRRVKRRIDEGRWEVLASTWVEGDLNMAGYETLARQFLLGKSYSREVLGADPEICWEPDTFGHPASIPQLLRQAGIRYYYHTRVGRGIPIYWWEGLDGSRVLVFNDPYHYSGRISASTVMPGSKALAQRYGLKRNMYLYGIGDHGGGVTRREILHAIRLNESPLLPRFEFGKAIDFYRDVEASGLDYPVIRGEMNLVFEGCFTTHADIKRANRETEHALVEAEALAAIVSIGSPDQSNETLPEQGVTAALLEAWRTQCYNQFHDIIGGCSIGSTYDEAVAAAADARDEAAALASASVQRLMTVPPADEAADAVVVLNSLSWARTDVVVLRHADHPQAADWQTGDWLVDDVGGRSMLQRGDEEILFVAKDVPSLGYRRYSYEKGEAATSLQRELASSRVGNPVLFNDRFRVEVDKESGTIVSLLDTAIERELTYGPQNLWVESNRNKGLLNLFEVQHEAPHTMSAWKIGTITQVKRLVSGAVVTVGEQGPVMQSLHIEHHFDGSTIRQEIRVYQDLDRIDFLTDVDWQEEGSGSTGSPMLRVLFTPRLSAAKAWFDIPFGALEREADGQEVPAIHWVDLCENGVDGYGLAVLNNAKYGHSVQGNTIALSLIRNPYEPDTQPDTGRHQFTYSIVPHGGGWREAQVGRGGWELNQPLRAVTGSSPTGQFSALAVEEYVYGQWQPARNVLVSSIRPAGEASGGTLNYVARIIEAGGARARIRVRVAQSLLAAEEVSLLEGFVRLLRVSEGQVIELGELRPWEVRTVRFGLDGR